MKTRILSIVMLLVVMTGISKLTYAATAKNNADYTVLSNIKSISKIEVRGNVELFISDNSTEQVKVYNKYYAENAFVQSSNGVLHISSYSAEKLIVWISTDNLQSVSAYDNAQIESFGKLSKIDFSVELHNSASAKLNLDAFTAKVLLRDNAKIELIGNATDFSINHNTGSMLINHDFSADHYYDTKVGTYGEIKSDVLTILE